LLFATEKREDAQAPETAIARDLLQEIADLRLEAAPTKSCLQYSQALRTLNPPFTLSSAWSPHHSDPVGYCDIATEAEIETFADLREVQRHVVAVEAEETLESWELRVRNRLFGAERGVRAVVMPITVLQCCLKLVNCTCPQAVFAYIDLSQPAKCRATAFYADIRGLGVLAALRQTDPVDLKQPKAAEEEKFDRKLILINCEIANSPLLPALKRRLESLTFTSQPLRLESPLYRPSLKLAADLLELLHCPFLLKCRLNPSTGSSEALEIPKKEEIKDLFASLKLPFASFSDSSDEASLITTIYGPFEGVRVLILSKEVMREVCEDVLRLRDYQPDSLVSDVHLDQPHLTQTARNSTEFSRIKMLRSIDEFKSVISEEPDEDMRAAVRENILEWTEEEGKVEESGEVGLGSREIEVKAAVLVQEVPPKPILEDSPANLVQAIPSNPPILEVPPVPLPEPQVKLEETPLPEPRPAQEQHADSVQTAKEVIAGILTDFVPSEAEKRPESPWEVEKSYDFETIEEALVPEMREVTAVLPILETAELPKEPILPLLHADSHPIPSELPPSQSFSDIPPSPSPYLTPVKADLEPLPSLPAPADFLVISEVLEPPTEPLLSSIPCLDGRKKLLYDLNMKLNRDLVETLIGEMGLCSGDRTKSPAEEAISQAMGELDWVRGRFLDLSGCLARTSKGLSGVSAEQREDIGELTRELGEIQAKEREMQGKLARNVREMIEKGRFLRQSLEERQKVALELSARIKSLREPVQKPPKVEIKEVSISETGSLKAQIFLRSFHSYQVQAHLYGANGYSQKFPLSLTQGNNSYEFGIYHNYQLGYLGLIIENLNSEPLGPYYNFCNDLEKGEDLPFEETFVARNSAGIYAFERELTAQGRQTLRTLAVAWRHPKIELLEHFLSTVRSRQGEGLSQVCWSLRSSGLLFAGLGL